MGDGLFNHNNYSGLNRLTAHNLTNRRIREFGGEITDLPRSHLTL